MSKKGKASALAVAFAPELTVVLALVFLVALVAWYGKDWWAKLTAPFAYWGSSLAAIFDQLAGGDPVGAFQSLVGRVQSGINSARGNFTSGQWNVFTGTEQP